MTIIDKSMFLKKKDKSLLLAPEGVKTETVDIPDDELLKKPKVCGLTPCQFNIGVYFITLVVIFLGFRSGLYLYNEYGRTQLHQFQGWSQIRVKDNELQSQKLTSVYNDDDAEMLKHRQLNEILNSFREYFEIGLEEDNYEKIDVPDFNDGRRGRFIHDFDTNKTGIMDPEGKRCFVMPLDREAVLPPKSLLDLINKLKEEYYEVDMNFVKQNMRVVLPAVKDFTNIGGYIARDCSGYPTYNLEKFVSGVYKRSIQENLMKYIEFAGTSFQEIDILNMEEVLKYEKENNL